MNAVIEHFPGSGVTALSDRRQMTRVTLGVAISLALHALFLSTYRQPQPSALPATVVEPLTVRLQAPEAAAVAEPEPPAPQAKPESRPAPRARAPGRIIAVPPQAAPSAEEKLHVETPPLETPPAAQPHFDLDAARAVARRVANEPDPAKKGTALERLPPPPLQTESKLERGIRQAKRPLCKDGVPGGLLAPIFLAMDKKDSGCKW